MSYRPWYALAEFVDNATQSYFDNKETIDQALSAEGQRFEVSITYDRQSKTIRIVDNAMGMSLPELQSALHVGLRPSNTAGRSEYGMGLKTAACWFGQSWSVTTKKLGSPTEYSVTVDVEKVAEGDTDLGLHEFAKPEAEHYTVLEIRQMNRQLNGWSIRNTKEYLAAMYGRDIESDVLDLKFENVSLEAPTSYDTDAFLRRVDGTPYKTAFSATINGKDVRGWVGVLRPGVASRRLAGISVIRRGRVIRGWLDSWRPEEIYGPGGRNDLLNQRLAGEIEVDDFEVSHTKDAILFDGDEEDTLVDALKTTAEGSDLLQVAKDHRGDSPTAPSPAEKEAALEELKRGMESPEFVNTVELVEVPPPELEDFRTEPMFDESERSEADIVVRVGNQLVVYIYLLRLSRNDPYYAFDLRDGPSILLTINENHPGYTELRGEEAVRSYLKHCAFDAVAEWKCRKMVGDVRPESVRQIKDELFRVATETG